MEKTLDKKNSKPSTKVTSNSYNQNEINRNKIISFTEETFKNKEPSKKTIMSTIKKETKQKKYKAMEDKN